MRKILTCMRGNFHTATIAAGMLAALFVVCLVPGRGFPLFAFFLPVALAGYYGGVRLAVPAAMFCLAAAVLHVTGAPEPYEPLSATAQAVAFVCSWAVFFVVSGAFTVRQQDKLIAERAHFTGLHGTVLEAYDRLKRARAETVIGMATLSECRDRQTGEHLQRVSGVCRIIALELRRAPPLDSYITDEYVEDLVLSSVLHDIGKVGIPDVILLKKGSLTREEFEAMKVHTTVGGDALTAIEKRMEGRSIFTLGKQIAYCHHERWDGTGYPRGLRGEEIPLSARIVAVADAYDAIISDRVYRPGSSHAEAVRRIKHSSGTQFDPRIVDAFAACEVAVGRLLHQAAVRNRRALAPCGKSIASP